MIQVTQMNLSPSNSSNNTRYEDYWMNYINNIESESNENNDEELSPEDQMLLDEQIDYEGYLDDCYEREIEADYQRFLDHLYNPSYVK